MNGFDDTVLGDGNASFYNINTTATDYEVINIIEDELFKPTFLKQTIGLAGFITKSLLVSLDASFYIPIQQLDENFNVADLSAERVFTWNINTGVEWYITPNFPIRAGFFTDMANTPEVEDGIQNQQEHVDLFGGSFSFGYATSSMSVNIGGTFSGGVGEAQILGNSNDIQELHALNVNLFISGGYSF